MPPRQRAANRNNQANQQGNHENENIQRLLDLSENTFSDANAFNRTLAGVMLGFQEQLQQNTDAIKQLNNSMTALREEIHNMNPPKLS